RARAAGRPHRRRRIDARGRAPHSGRKTARALRGLAAGVYGRWAGLTAGGLDAVFARNRRPNRRKRSGGGGKGGGGKGNGTLEKAAYAGCRGDDPRPRR